MKLPKKLEEKRDEMASVCGAMCSASPRDRYDIGLISYESGFNEACVMLLPLIKKIRLAIDIPEYCGEHNHRGHLLDHKDCDEIKYALSKIREVVGEE